MIVEPVPAPDWRRNTLCVGALALVALAVLALAATADAAPTATRKLFGIWRTHDLLLAGGLVVSAGALLAATLSRHALFGYVAIWVCAAGILVLLEVAGAAGVVSWRELLAPSRSTLGTKRVPLLDIDGVTFQETAPQWGLPSDPIRLRYRTDRYGFRNEIDRAAADIYLLGDSILVAALVPFAETITARLEAAIGRSVMQVALIGVVPQEAHQFFRDAGVEVR